MAKKDGPVLQESALVNILGLLVYLVSLYRFYRFAFFYPFNCGSYTGILTLPTEALVYACVMITGIDFQARRVKHSRLSVDGIAAATPGNAPPRGIFGHRGSLWLYQVFKIYILTIVAILFLRCCQAVILAKGSITGIGIREMAELVIHGMLQSFVAFVPTRLAELARWQIMTRVGAGRVVRNSRFQEPNWWDLEFKEMMICLWWVALYWTMFKFKDFSDDAKCDYEPFPSMYIEPLVFLVWILC